MTGAMGKLQSPWFVRVEREKARLSWEPGFESRSICRAWAAGAAALGRGAGLFGSGDIAGKVRLAASWGFTAKGETSCFPVPYSCPCWELFPGRDLIREHGEAGTEQGKIWAGWRSHEGPGLSGSAAGTGISSGVHWLVLLENRRLTHLVPT